MQCVDIFIQQTPEN